MNPPLWPEPDPRTLKVQLVWSTKAYKGPQEEWDLARGFRVQALAPGWFAFFLGGRSLALQEDPLSLRPAAAEEAFLLGVPPQDAGPQWLEEGRSCLIDLDWSTGVVALLADYRDKRQLAPLSRGTSSVFSGVFSKGAAFWVWQPMPWPRRGEGLAFFAVEQQLYQWGRVGRHLRRSCRWRRLWPWSRS